MGEMSWRKMDRSIIRNENLLYIADQLPPELQYTPWMFYYAALSVADDDGVFDLEDGIVFSRLMKVRDPKIVFTVANLLMQRKLILRANSSSSKCIIVNWGQKDSDTRTMEQRRQTVSRKIEEERKTKETQVLFNEGAEAFCVDFATKPSSDYFFADLNDKNNKFVAANIIDDKNCKNVDKTEREKERQRVNPRENLERDIDREKETHTERKASGSLAGLPPSENEDYTDYTETEDYIEQEETLSRENVSLVDEAYGYGKAEKVVDKSIQVYSYLVNFFAKNNLGFEETEHLAALNELSGRLAKLSDSKNPPEIVAITFTEQYKKLLENSQYYKDQPILPEYMIKSNCYSHILAMVSRILLNRNSDATAWEEQARLYRQEVEQERAAVGDSFEAEYIKYGIDPTDPAATAKLLKIKSQQHQQGSNTG